MTILQRPSTASRRARCAWILGALALLVAPSASAEEECGDQLCADGFQCTSATIGYCEACPAPEIDPETGEVLGDGVDEECGGCFEEEVLYCSRAECETDADCGDAMLCGTFESVACSGSAPSTQPDCAPGEDCPVFEVEEPECTSTETSYCAFPHELPCEGADDCGEGYECLPAQICTCSGGGVDGEPMPNEPMEDMEGGGSDDTPSAPPGVTPPPENAPPTDPVGVGGAPGDSPGGVGSDDDFECSCEPTGEGYCSVQEIACDSDADCPSDWSCISFGGACTETPDGQVECFEGESQCYPQSDLPGIPPSPGGGTGGDTGAVDPGDVDQQPGTDPGSEDGADEEGGMGESETPDSSDPTSGNGDANTGDSDEATGPSHGGGKKWKHGHGKKWRKWGKKKGHGKWGQPSKKWKKKGFGKKRKYSSKNSCG